MRSPRPHTEEWRRWKDNRLPAETYEDFLERKGREAISKALLKDKEEEVKDDG